MGIDPAKASQPEPEGELHSIPMRVDVDSETVAALQRRADLKLARLFVRAANEDHRIIAADYYPAVVGSIPGENVHDHLSSAAGRQARHRVSHRRRVEQTGPTHGG